MVFGEMGAQGTEHQGWVGRPKIRPGSGHHTSFHFHHFFRSIGTGF